MPIRVTLRVGPTVAVKRPTKSIESVLDDIGLGGLGALFDRMGVADEVLGYMGNPPGGFLACFPRSEMPEKLYRHFCEEQAQRCIDGERTDEATTAEILMSLVNASLTAPLEAGAAAAYERLFKQVLPDAEVPGLETRESWNGQVNEIIHELRTRITREIRR